ncbi:response regulator transcription factor [Metabacillus idriensis]|uniref:response regulator transcription factor n=1 Tax=Metabacillus idriensis TaxID=324768 RepID=UPI0028144474|nr:response regulator transcription factor [Metabacillus idriensis]MDR0139541.1 response regulator transcription factor [Metabacillus idriensis]
MATILITEDDANIRRLISDHLVNTGYRVLESSDGEDALKVMESHHIDLLITDVMMPAMDGLELTSDLRKSGFEFPILMITALETFEDKKNGFSSGGDDYMVKPVDMEEMLLRVAALLRRAKISASKILEIGSTVLNQEQMTITSCETVIELPSKEFQLLHKLLSNPRKIFTRQQLMDEIWGYDVQSSERTVDVHIKRLREKLSAIKDFEIVTVWGLGYKAEKRGNV